MNRFIVGPLVKEQVGGGAVVRAEVQSPGRISELWFRTTGFEPWSGEDILTPAVLFCAMRTGLPLQIKGCISAQQAGNLDLIQAIFSKWYPECKKVGVEWERLSSAPRDEKGGTGCFFSGGLDSFYTYFRHESEIDSVVLVHGLDFWLDDHGLRQQVANELRAVADMLGKPLIEVETNLREFTDQFLDYGLHCSGGALASVALLLSSSLERMYLPASANYAHLDPWSSHPMLDHLWGTERLSIVHDGCEATRVEKARIVARSDIAITHLRVCYQNLHERGHYGERPAAWNCGRCEKCVRTMLNLYVCDALEHCPTFRAPLTPSLVRETVLHDDPALFHMQDNLVSLRNKEGETELVRALSECVDNYRRRRAIQVMSEQGQGFFSSQLWQDFALQRRATLFKALRSVWGSWMTRESFKEDIKSLLRTWR